VQRLLNVKFQTVLFDEGSVAPDDLADDADLADVGFIGRVHFSIFGYDQGSAAWEFFKFLDNNDVVITQGVNGTSPLLCLGPM